MPQTITGALALITADAQLLSDLERLLPTTATPHDAHPLSWFPTVPGMGDILRRVLRSDIHDLDRFPRVQEGALYGRLGPDAKASGGTRRGTAGHNIGNAPLQWAFAEAAPVFLRPHEGGQT